MSRVTFLAISALVIASIALPVQSQNWPAQPVKVIHPFAPGGGAETLARVVVDGLSRNFGQQFVLENRPGAGGTLGAAVVTKARPDGYTLLVSGISSLVVGPAYLGASFDPMNDFTHIAFLGGLLQCLAINPKFEAKTLRQLVELSRVRPKGIAFGTPGVGSHTHLFGEMFQARSKANLVHVPYKGGGPMSTDLVASFIPSAFMTLNAAAPLVRAGKLKLVAIAGKTRVEDFSEVPTFSEEGYSDLVASTWFSLSGPAGVPRPIVIRLNAATRAVFLQPEVRKPLLATGIEFADMTPEEFTEYVRSETARWAPVARSVKSKGVK